MQYLLPSHAATNARIKDSNVPEMFFLNQIIIPPKKVTVAYYFSMNKA
jgi:hypothetical protein